MRPAFRVIVAAVLFVPTLALAQSARGVRPDALPGLQAAAEITRDVHGIAHIRAGNEHDLFFLQGYVHAQDRLFQMDMNRRTASGTIAELLGAAAIANDVELRTIGIRRAAERTWPAVGPRARAALEAYAAGVNAWVNTHPLPPEYKALELTKFQPWTEVDSVAVAKSIAFSLSFDLGDIESTQALLTYSGVFDGALGAGAGYMLYSEDLYRAQPFYPASSVPDAQVVSSSAASRAGQRGSRGGRASAAATAADAQAPAIDQTTMELASRYLAQVKKVPFLRRVLDRENPPGSNQWAVAPRLTTTGRTLFASDPHLALDAPTTFYPIHLEAGAYDVMGNGFAGAPFVIIGHNRWIAWGATVNPIDVTDVYQEQLVPDPTSPSGYSSLYKGTREPVIPVPELFRYNQLGNGTANDLVTATPGGTIGSTYIPPVTLIVPRRNHGPIVQLDQATGKAISIQFTGFGVTHEIETFPIWDTARSIEDFVEGLQLFDVGGQNFVVTDVKGNIAYFTSCEIPIREDLQAGTVKGLPPWFIRDGQKGENEWLPVQNPQYQQALPYEILPFSEMPQIVNPPAGWVINANNDPAGTNLDNDPINQLRPGGGIYYLYRIYDAGFRAGRITELVREKTANGGKIAFEDMQAIQGDVQLPDAPYFVPTILNAFTRGQSSSIPAFAGLTMAPGVAEAVVRFSKWQFTAPTGIVEGYDFADVNGQRADPDDKEIAESIAATIYSAWRAQFIRNTIDATLGGVPLPPGITLPKPPSQLAMTALKTLLQRPVPGVGASGLNFFNVPGVTSADDRRDVLILKSLADTLVLLKSDAFRAAFNNSPNQDDYRWGKLHRIVFDHPLGSPFSIPPAGGAFLAPLPGLKGIPTDGGFGVVDASNHDARASSVDAFMYGSGPTNRFVAEGEPWGMRAESVWPGGMSGVLGNPHYVDQLPWWLTNDTFQLLYRQGDLNQKIESVTKFVPGR